MVQRVHPLSTPRPLHSMFNPNLPRHAPVMQCSVPKLIRAVRAPPNLDDALRYLFSTRSRFIPRLDLVDGHCPFCTSRTIAGDPSSVARDVRCVRRTLAGFRSMRPNTRHRCSLGHLGHLSWKACGGNTNCGRRHGAAHESQASYVAYCGLLADLRDMRSRISLGSIHSP